MPEPEQPLPHLSVPAPRQSRPSALADPSVAYAPFYLAAGLLAVVGFLGLVTTLLYPDVVRDRSLLPPCFLISAALVPLAAVFFVWPALAERRIRAAQDLPRLLREVESRAADLDLVRREHYRARQQFEGFVSQVQDERLAMANLRQEFAAVILDRKKLDDEITRLRQAGGSQARQTDKWQKVAIEFFRSLERAIDPAARLAPDYRQALERTVKDFARLVGPLGLELIRPEPGDDFDDRIHQFDGEEETAEVSPGQVSRCTGWGFRAGAVLVERARVTIAQPLSVGNRQSSSSEVRSP
jgi:molecular chaperone GrpE (heat shock protein)